MKIGILGNGNIGSSLAVLWHRAGHEVVLAGGDRQEADRIASRIGVMAGDNPEAVRFGEAVLLALRWGDLGFALKDGVAEALAGKIAIDVTNPYGPASIAVPAGMSCSEAVAAALPGAKVVKAFNTMQASVMSALTRNDEKRSLAIFYCGNDSEAKSAVAQLINDSGFVPCGYGALANGRLAEPGNPLYDTQLSLPEAEALLARVQRA